MELFQILDCSSVVGSCCSDYSMVMVLEITRRIFELIQFVVPVVLIVAGTIQFVQMTINPELKDGFRKILNKLIAAIIIFLLPALMDVVLGAVSSNVSIAACWEQAKNTSSELGFNSGKYISTDDDEPTIVSSFKYNLMNTGKNMKTKLDDNVNAVKVAKYAVQFEGQPYQLGGTWNGEEPYTATDCCGFVVGVYKHFGVNLPVPCKNMLNNDPNVEKISESEIRAGDIVVYAPQNGYWHYAILTGRGNEIIHASNKKDGVKLSSNYKYREIKAFLRVKMN